MNGIAQNDWRDGTLRVLFGNSELLFNGLIGAMLERYLGGIRVLPQQADTASKLLRLSQTQEFDLEIVILNNLRYDLTTHPSTLLNLPERGLDLVRQLKQVSHCPILALAASPWDHDPDFSNKAKLAGADWFLRLPFSPEQLFSLLGSAFPRAQDAPTAHALA